MNTENSKTIDPHKFVLNLSQRLDLKMQIKILLFYLSIYYTWKSIKKQYKNKKLKIIAPTWNYESELPDDFYSVSNIQVYIRYIIKKHETLSTIPPIRVYINTINNRLVLKIRDGYKLELQTPETNKLFYCAKKLIDKTKTENKYQVLK